MAGRKTRLRGRAGSYITQSLRRLQIQKECRDGRPGTIVYPPGRELEKGIRGQERPQIGRAEPRGRPERQTRRRNLQPRRGISRTVVLSRQIARQRNRNERRARHGKAGEFPQGWPDEQLEADERAERVAGEAEDELVRAGAEEERLARLHPDLVQVGLDPGLAKDLRDEVVLAR